MTKIRQRTVIKAIGRTWSEWREVPITDEMRAEHPMLKHCAGIRSNSRFEVLLFNCGTKLGGVVQCQVRRHGDVAPIEYADLMRIKLELFGEDAQAVEIFPRPADEWPNRTPLRVLWILPHGYDLGFGLHCANAFGRPTE